MIPLNFAEVGKECVIKKIGGSPEVKKHLENLGFSIGGSATLINTVGGNVIVKVKLRTEVLSVPDSYENIERCKSRRNSSCFKTYGRGCCQAQNYGYGCDKGHNYFRQKSCSAW